MGNFTSAASAAIRRIWRSPLRGLAMLCAWVNIAESAVVMLFGHGLGLVLAPQASAVGPLGVFHDLRWLAVYDESWWGAAAEIAGSIVVRGLFMALAVSLAWGALRQPGEGQVVDDRPKLKTLWIWGSGAALLFAVALTLPVAAMFAAAVVPVSWLYIAAVPSVVMISLLAHPAGITRQWWRRPIPLRSLAWVLGDFAVATLGGALVAGLPDSFSFVVAAAVGLFHAVAWRGMVRAYVLHPEPRRFLPVVPAGLVLVVVGAVVGAVAGFSLTGKSPDSRQRAASVADKRDGQETPLLIVAGYGTSWQGNPIHPIPGDFEEEQFSYRGLNPAGHPLSYSHGDTVKPLDQLARMVSRQVVAMASASGKKVDIVAVSEGSLAVEVYLHATPSAPVASVVLESPLLAPARVSYVTVGSQGWGFAGGEAMELLGSIFATSAPFNVSPQNAFLRSVAQGGPILQDLSSCPLREHLDAIVPLADELDVPPHLDVAFPVVVVSGFHGGMTGNSSVDLLTEGLLHGKSPPENTLLRLAAYAVSWSGWSWHVPSMERHYFPHSTVDAAVLPVSNDSFGPRSPERCAAVDAALRSSLGG